MFKPRSNNIIIFTFAYTIFPLKWLKNDNIFINLFGRFPWRRAPLPSYLKHVSVRDASVQISKTYSCIS